MQVSVESPSKIERRVTITVPVAQLDAAYEKSIAKLSKTIKIDGFRPGKVPAAYVQKRFGDTARQEALSEIIQSSFYTAMTEQKLNPIGAPTVEPKTVVAGQPLEFVATFEVLPEIDKVLFDVKKIEKETAVITDKDIDSVLDRLREQSVVWNVVNRPAQEKDQVIIDFVGKRDGKPFQGGEAHDYPVVLGAKTMIPGFEEGLLGLKAGDEKVLPITFPADYFAKDMAGAIVEFTIKVIKVSEPKLPDINEELVKSLGIKSGLKSDLTAEIRKNMERELTRVIKSKLKAQLFDKLLEQNPIDIPKALIEQEASRIHDEVHPHHPGEHHGHTDAEMTGFRTAAKRSVALGLLMAEFIKEHKLTPTKEQIKTYIDSIASSYEKPDDVIKWYTTDKRGRAEAEMHVLEDQVVEKLLEKVQLTEKAISYHELTQGIQQ